MPEDPSSELWPRLRRRGELLKRLRDFFYARDFVEVETPLLADEVIPETHIEPLTVQPTDRCGNTDQLANSWLQASPELFMKCLLGIGAEAIFQVTRSFRGGERGPLHNPEFTILEWYRTGDDMAAGMQLLDEFCQHLLATPPARNLRYGDAFQQLVGICPYTASGEDLETAALAAGPVPDRIPSQDRDTWLQLLLTTQVEPQLGHDRPVILFDYPASQAALATTRDHHVGIRVAERFELYYRGVELANGYHELVDPEQLQLRLQKANDARVSQGRAALPLPTTLLSATASGLPAATGVAVGIDRVVMLALGAESIHDVRA